MKIEMSKVIEGFFFLKKKQHSSPSKTIIKDEISH